VQRALLDMSTTAQINDSLQAGHGAAGRDRHVGKLHKPRVEQAGFAVLKAPDIPSVLVETAFISNPEEEARLRSDAYQEQLADALMRGITRYFAKNPPLARSRQVPDVIEQAAQAGPGYVVQQQVVALCHDQRRVGCNRDCTGHGLFDLPSEIRCVNHLRRGLCLYPAQQIDVACRIKRVWRTLAGTSAQALQLGVGQVKTVHWNDLDKRAIPGQQCLCQSGFTRTGRSHNAQDLACSGGQQVVDTLLA
jgi:hypothetical protein